MRSLLPWINYPSRDSVWPSNSPPAKMQLSPSLSKQFKLKTICKHVSDYQKSSTPADASDEGQVTTSTFYRKKLTGDSTVEIRKMKADRKENIMRKAKEVNNRYYAPLMKKSSSKEAKKCQGILNSISLNRFSQERLSFGKTGKLSVSKSSKQSFFPAHSRSPTDLTSQLNQFKQGRPFRSKWFTELRSLE